jgi:MinD-like ATPase involved in chromosome partitioning or flagellar assembly
MSSGTWHAPVPERTRHLIAVGSAQPGVGKSVVASNLAVALASRGQKVVLVDLDPRTPRLHALLGTNAMRGSLQAWLEHKRDTRDATPVATRVRNLRLLPYAGSSEIRAGAHRAIVDAMTDLDGDVVVVDLGTDNRGDLFEYFASSALRLLVTPDHREGLEASYAFLKTAALRAERRHGTSARAVLERFQGGMVGNWVADAAAAESLHAFSRLVREHLGIPMPLVACLAGSDRIPQSIAGRTPLVARRGVDGNVAAFHQLAEWALAGSALPSRECRLDGDDVSLSPAPLPADLGRYVRRHPRFPVDWAATLELAKVVTAVRVKDISASGAGVEAAQALQIGDRALLHLDQMPGRPALGVEVKGIVPSLRRIGLSFLNPNDEVARLLAIAQNAARV